MSEPRVLAFVDLCAIGARLGVPPHRFVFVDLVAAAVRQQCVDRRRSSSLQIVRYAGIADIHGKLRTIAPLEDLMQADQHVLQLSLEVLTHCHCLRGTPEWVVQGLAESLCLVDATMDARQKAMIVASWIPSCASLPSPSAFPLPFTDTAAVAKDDDVVCAAWVADYAHARVRNNSTWVAQHATRVWTDVSGDGPVVLGTTAALGDIRDFAAAQSFTVSHTVLAGVQPQAAELDRIVNRVQALQAKAPAAIAVACAAAAMAMVVVVERHPVVVFLQLSACRTRTAVFAYDLLQGVEKAAVRHVAAGLDPERRVHVALPALSAPGLPALEAWGAAKIDKVLNIVTLYPWSDRATCVRVCGGVASGFTDTCTAREAARLLRAFCTTGPDIAPETVLPAYLAPATTFPYPGSIQRQLPPVRHVQAATMFVLPPTAYIEFPEGSGQWWMPLHIESKYRHAGLVRNRVTLDPPFLPAMFIKPRKHAKNATNAKYHIRSGKALPQGRTGAVAVPDALAFISETWIRQGILADSAHSDALLAAVLACVDSPLSVDEAKAAMAASDACVSAGMPYAARTCGARFAAATLRRELEQAPFTPEMLACAETLLNVRVVLLDRPPAALGSVAAPARLFPSFRGVGNPSDRPVVVLYRHGGTQVLALNKAVVESTRKHFVEACRPAGAVSLTIEGTARLHATLDRLCEHPPPPPPLPPPPPPRPALRFPTVEAELQQLTRLDTAIAGRLDLLGPDDRLLWQGLLIDVGVAGASDWIASERSKLTTRHVDCRSYSNMACFAVMHADPQGARARRLLAIQNRKKQL